MVMAVRVAALYRSPVKSLAMERIDRARVEKAGIEGDRAFFIVNGDGGLVTQREAPTLVQVHARYDVAAQHLELRFRSGVVATDRVRTAGRVAALFFGEREVVGELVAGPFSDALSRFAGRPLRLVKAPPGSAFDGFPISICSQASGAALASAAGIDHVDLRRFRQNVIIEGVQAHEEDEWIGGQARIGATLVLNMKMRDFRCVITTHDPDTGDTDMNTLKLIASYRTDQPSEVNFGVYATVRVAGEIAVGDAVSPQTETVPA
jgi:uncharacterized protein YcbX